MSRRLRVLKAFFSIWAVCLILRLGYWQILKAPELQKTAAMQYGHTTLIAAPRGQILAADGFPLAKNKDTYLLFAEAQKLDLTSEMEKRVLDLINASDSAKLAFNQARNTQQTWLPLQHYVSSEIKDAIEQLEIVGLGFSPEPTRLYLEGSSSAHITGFVGKNSAGENQGYFGLEGYYNRALSGKPGKVTQDSDAFNRPIVVGLQNTIQLQPGQNLITSIDRTVQFAAATKLKEGIEKYQADSGSVAIMETHTGRILAMASYPGYDPQNYQSFDESLYKNPIVSDGYEPGSTFKVLVMGAALDAGVISPDTICSTCDGPQTISGQTVRSYNNHYYPQSSMADVILHSDNVGMVFVGRKLGPDRLLSYLKKFGLGQLTGIDLEEEDTPKLRPDDQWRDIDLATATFGQGIALTRIQMLAAVNSIANRGNLISPRLVTAIGQNGEIKNLPSTKPKRVISETAAAQVVQMMKNGVENGEVRYYRVPNYSTAGKTGTAQIPIEGHYDKDNVIASFIGFAPVNNPKFTMLVTLRDPKTSPWGSTTAAPLWFSIAKELFRYYKIPPG